MVPKKQDDVAVSSGCFHLQLPQQPENLHGTTTPVDLVARLDKCRIATRPMTETQ
eukprot:CAMPEP_0172757716 /NCGR_PEP_ID=MMETSP1074-20121228/164352_1 /TAXON_ID=2916 /ORGANISM="Ceratium fusus, Strain PA161109" /LENGTH=54 /DNA_ID=CAMNT_0013591181 /DNA_START=1033 /DNA_END=1197 /DNA_ORIENTATION=-